MAPDTADLAASIYNAAWYLRNRRRGSSTIERAQAILLLGLAVRHAFAVSDDFEALLVAIFDGLNKKDDLPF